MAVSAAALELKVLISILQSGNALQTMLGQVNQLSNAVAKLQTQAGKGGLTPPLVPPGGGPSGGPGGPLKQIPKDANAAEDALKSLDATIAKVVRGVQFLSGGFLALQGVQFLKSLADTAARAEVLTTVLHIVAKNAGVTSTEIDKVSREVQRLGITAQAANQSLSQFLQSGLDVKFAGPLARAAQDLAVIAGSDSSAVFERLITNIQQLDTLGLRHMGIIVDRSAAEEKYAATIHKVKEALTQEDKQTAFLIGTLDKAKNLQGAYEAAMGNVGKQLTSLARLTTNLATAMGNQLLPAFSALVLEYTNFLLKSTDIATSMNTNKSAAEALAEVVRTLAHVFFELVLSLERLYAKFSTLFNWLVVIYGVVKLAPPVFRAAGAMLSFFFNIISTGIVYLVDFASALFVAAEAIGAFLTIGTGGGFAVIAAAIGLIGYGIYKLVGQSADASKSLETLAAKDRELALARDKVTDAAKRYTAANATGTQAALDQAFAELQLAKAELKRLEEAKQTYIDNLTKTDPNRLRKEEVEARAQKDLNTFLKLKAAAQKAADELSVTIQGVDVLPKDFSTKLADLKTLGDEYDSLRDKLKGWNKELQNQAEIKAEDRATALRRRVEEAKELAPKVTTPEALAGALPEFQRTRKAVQDQGREVGFSPAVVKQMLRDVDIAVATAKIKSTSGARDFRTTVDAQSSAFFREHEARTAASLDHDLALLKIRNQSFLASDKALYDQGGLSLEKYYADRLTVIQSENALELATAVNARDAIRREQKLGVSRTPEENAALETRARTAEGKIAEVRARGREEEVDLGRQQAAEVLGTSREIQAIRLKNAAAVGTEADAEAVINQEFAIRLEKFHQLKGAQEALEGERQLALRENHLTYLDKALQKQLDSIQAREDELTLEQAILDVDTRRIEVAQQLGFITELDAKRLRNAQLLRQIELDREKLRQKELQQVQLVTAYGRLSEEIEARRKDGKSPTDAEVDRLKALRQQVLALGGDITTLDGQIAAATGKLELYGRELQEVFKAGLADIFTEAFSGALNKYKDFMQTLVDFSVSLSRQIASTFGKKLASSITTSIVRATSKKDDKGDPIPGTSGFDKVFKLLGLSTTDPLGSKNNPSYTKAEVTNAADFANANGPSIGQSGIPDIRGLVQSGVGNIAGQLGSTNLTPLVNLLTSNLFTKKVAASVTPQFLFPTGFGLGLAGGGPVKGPGTGTSDSIPAMLSTGEHIMPADKAAKWMPLLEGIRTGKILPFRTGGVVQSIALDSIIPRYYAGGGMVVADAGASAVQPAGGIGNMVVSLHPDTMNMTMREWLEHEVVRQHGRR